MYQDLTFKNAVGILLIEEGGYVDDPDDPGGETNYGISKRSYPNLDIKNLTVDKAIEIYYNDFWLKYKINSVQSLSIATQLLLMFVNLSPVSASTCIQKALNKMNADIAEDGVFGTQCIKAINSLPECHVSDHIRLELVRFYYRRVMINKTQLKNLAGWIGRALK